MKNLFVIITLAFFIIVTSSCKHSADKAQSGSEQNITGQVAETDYKPDVEVEVLANSVKIGDQEWMLKNLDVETYRNGDPISAAKTNPEWEVLGESRTGAWGYFNNDSSEGEKYGKIYNWFAVNDPRGLCPAGWRVPTDDDWQKLIDNFGGEMIAAPFLKDSQGWEAGGEGNNQSGFAALPGGFRGYEGTSYQIGYFGSWWSATEDSEFFAWGRNMVYDSKVVGRASGYKMDGFSVRCLKE